MKANLIFVIVISYLLILKEPIDFMNRSKDGQFQKQQFEVVINNMGSTVSFVTQDSQELEQKIRASQIYQNQNLIEQDYTKLDYQSFCQENQQNFEVQEEYAENLNILKQLNSDEKRNKLENQPLQNYLFQYQIEFQFIKRSAFSHSKHSQFQELKNQDSINPLNGQNNINIENGLGTLNSSRQLVQNPMQNSLNMQCSESDFQTGNFGSLGIKADNFQEMVSSQKQQQIKDKQMQNHEQKNKQFLSQYARTDEIVFNSNKEEQKHNTHQNTQPKEQIHFHSQIYESNQKENIQNRQRSSLPQQQNQNSSHNHKSNSLTNINQFLPNNSQLFKENISKSGVFQNDQKQDNHKKFNHLNLDLNLIQNNNTKGQNKKGHKTISANQSHSEKYAVVGNEIGPDESNNNLMQFEHFQSESSQDGILSDDLSEIKNKKERRNSENVSILDGQNLNDNFANAPYSQRQITEKMKIDQRENQQSPNRQSLTNINQDYKNTSNSSFEYQSIHQGSTYQFKEQYSGYENNSMSQNYASFQQEQLNSSRQQQAMANNQVINLNQKSQLENESNQFSIIGEEQSHQDKESEQNTQKSLSLQSDLSKNGDKKKKNEQMFIQNFTYEKENKKNQFQSLQDMDEKSIQNIQTLMKSNRFTLGAEGINKLYQSSHDEKNSHSIFGLDPIKKSNFENSNITGSNIKIDTPKRNSILEIQSHIHKRQFSSEQNDIFDTDSQKAGYWKEKFDIAAKKEQQYKKSIEEQKQTLQFLKSDINKLEFLHRMEKPMNSSPTEKLENNEAKFQTWHLIFLAIASALFGFMIKKLTLL